jgi:hypothetical protein
MVAGNRKQATEAVCYLRFEYLFRWLDTKSYAKSNPVKQNHKSYELFVCLTSELRHLHNTFKEYCKVL